MKVTVVNPCKIAGTAHVVIENKIKRLASAVL